MSRLDELIQQYCPNGVEYKELPELFYTRNGYTPSKNNDVFWSNGTIPWFRMEDIRENGNILSDALQHVNKEAIKGNLFPANSIIVATSATIGVHALITVPSLANQRFTYLMLKEEYKNRIDIKFIYYYCYKLDDYCRSNLNQGNFASVDMQKFVRFKFPIPPLSVQEEIVRILDKFTELTAELQAGLQSELQARKKQYEYYRNTLLTMDDNIPKKTIEQLCKVSAGGDVPKDAISKEKTNDYLVPIISNGVGENALYGYTNTAKIIEPAVTVAARGTIGYAEYRNYPYFPIIRLLSMIPNDNDELDTKYLYYCLQGKHYNVPTTGIPQLTAPMVKQIDIPVPALYIQKRIVDVLDYFEKICTDFSNVLPAEIEARQKQYEYYRDKLLTFKPLS